jgi:hypothetical protein
VANLVDPPSRLRSPALLGRAVIGNVRNRRSEPARTPSPAPRVAQSVARVDH